MTGTSAVASSYKTIKRAKLAVNKEIEVVEQPKLAAVGSPCKFAKNFSTFGGGSTGSHLLS